MEGEEETSSPFLFSEKVYDWLNVSLDYGITEYDFWNMTLAELTRLIESKKRVKLENDRRRASFDYTLADLIGRSVSRIYNSENTLPTITDAYPSLFSSETVEQIEEIKQSKQDEVSAIRFIQFAQSFNNKFKEVSKEDE